MCCGWVAELLVKAGHRPEDARTAEIIERWSGTPARACQTGNSAAYLRRSNQTHDLDFILAHVNDLDLVCSMDQNEVYPLPSVREVAGSLRAGSLRPRKAPPYDG
jgi:phosphosulfolactate phosphohydrolase-like enzyme